MFSLQSHDTTRVRLMTTARSTVMTIGNGDFNTATKPEHMSVAVHVRHGNKRCDAATGACCHDKSSD